MGETITPRRYAEAARFRAEQVARRCAADAQRAALMLELSQVDDAVGLAQRVLTDAEELIAAVAGAEQAAVRRDYAEREADADALAGPWDDLGPFDPPDAEPRMVASAPVWAESLDTEGAADEA